MDARPTAPTTLIELFSSVAQDHPESIAIATPTVSRTYQQVNAESNQVAEQILASTSAGAGFIGVIVDRTPQSIVNVLGVLKAGMAYVPLDPGYPPDRLQYIIHDADLSIIIGNHEIAESFAADKCL